MKKSILNMSPCFSIDDSFYARPRHVKLFCKSPKAIRTEIIFFPYFSYLTIRKLCLSTFFSIWRRSVSPLSHSVQIIVASCTKPKMFRIYTRWVIASMKNAFSFWNRSKSNLPSLSMGKAIIVSHSTISSPCECAFPYPAGFSFFTVIEEIFGKFLAFSHCTDSMYINNFCQ
jgi:hypothetical protein